MAPSRTTEAMTRPARPRLASLACVLLAWGCGDDGAAEPLDMQLPDGGSRDAAPVEDLGPDDGEPDAGEPDAGAGACAPLFHPMLAIDQESRAVGDDALFARSMVDDTHSVSHGRGVRVRTNPGEELLPACSGGHFFGGRRDLPAPVPQGHTVWFRIFQYIPSEFSFGYKYSRNAGDGDEAAACGQSPDGNIWLKWLVFAPDDGTARIYLSPTVARRQLANPNPRVRIISEALHRAGDFSVNLPRDRWFALQMAVHVSDGDDGWIRAWIDDDYLGEVQGRTTVNPSSLVEWGMGDYWNGVPWTDGEPGRDTFWIDDIIVASDAEGYDAPTGIDAEGHPYIPSCIRAADLD